MAHGKWKYQMHLSSPRLGPGDIGELCNFLCAKYEQFCGDVVFDANRKPVVPQLLAKRE